MKALKPLIQSHASPAHASKGDVHGQLASVMKVGTDVQKQMIEYHAVLDAAELEDETISNKAEHVRQTLAAVEREASAYVQAGRNLAKAFTQLDRYMADLDRVITEFEASET